MTSLAICKLLEVCHDFRSILIFIASERAASLFTTILRQQKSQVTSVEYGEMANKVANFLFESGNSSAAVPLFQETVQLLTSLYTENSKEVSDVLYDFSRLYTQQAKYVEVWAQEKGELLICTG